MLRSPWRDALDDTLRLCAAVALAAAVATLPAYVPALPLRAARVAVAVVATVGGALAASTAMHLSEGDDAGRVRYFAVLAGAAAVIAVACWTAMMLETADAS